MDYSNTIFYKIYCVDPSINDLYIGHTTNFVQRKHAHKQGCNNVKSSNYNCKLYKVIRENTGWDNWKMDIIAFHNCDNLLGAKTQEQKYFEEYKATLNSIEPLSKSKPKIVNYVAKKEKSISSYNFYCENCHYKCKTTQHLTQHLTTRKHKMMNIDGMMTNVVTYKCNCGKEYKHRQGLYAHKQKCSQLREDNTCDKPEPEPEPEPTNKIVTVLLEQNAMFQELILKNEEQQRKSEEQRRKSEEQRRKSEEQRRKSEEEKNELLRRNQEQQSQMMDLHKQFLEAIKKSLQQ